MFLKNYFTSEFLKYKELEREREILYVNTTKRQDTL